MMIAFASTSAINVILCLIRHLSYLNELILARFISYVLDVLLDLESFFVDYEHSLDALPTTSLDLLKGDYMKNWLGTLAGLAAPVIASGLLGKIFGSSKSEKKFKARGFQNKSKNMKRGEIRSAFHRSEDCWD